MSKTLLVHWGQTGGGPKFHYELAKSWNEIYPREIAVSFNGNSEYAAAVRSLAIPSHEVATYGTSPGVLGRSYRLATNSLSFRAFLHKFTIDTIVSVMESIYQSLSIPILAPRSSLYVHCVHDATRHHGDEHLLKTIGHLLETRRADLQFTFSQSVANSLQLRSPTKPIYHSIHPAYLSSSPTLGVKSLTLTKSKPIRIGFFGRLLPYKGLRLLMDASEILREKEFPHVLSIVGSGPDEILRDEFTDPTITWDIRWVPDEEIPTLLERFDILALPYLEASQSGVLAFALGLGLPVVATPVGGLKEQVEDTGGGLVSHELTAESFASAIETLANNPVDYSEMSRAGLSSTTHDYTWERLVIDIRRAIDQHRCILH